MELCWNLWFHIFTKNLEKGVNNKVTKFTDDTKLVRVIKIAADWRTLREKAAEHDSEFGLPGLGKSNDTWEKALS